MSQPTNATIEEYRSQFGRIKPGDGRRPKRKQRKPKTLKTNIGKLLNEALKGL